MLAALAIEERTIVLYESPHRLLRTLGDLKAALGDRQISVAREITKKFEEVVRGTISGAIAHFTHHRVRGEFVLVVAGRSRGSGRSTGPARLQGSARGRKPSPSRFDDISQESEP